MTEQEVIQLICERAELIAKNPKFQEIVIQRGITGQEEVKKLGYQWAIATLLLSLWR